MLSSSEPALPQQGAGSDELGHTAFRGETTLILAFGDTVLLSQLGDAGYEGRGKLWAEEILNLSVEIMRKPKRPVPEEVAKIWAEEWAKEGKKIDWQGMNRGKKEARGC